MDKKLTKDDKAFIERSVRRYISNKDIYDALGDALFRTLTKSEALAPFVHSFKYRIKDPSSLRIKLDRKLKERGKRGWGINDGNIFQKVNDLVGIRILHLHTSQIVSIDRELRQCLSVEKYELVSGPIAKTWDLEYQNYFSSIGFETEESPRQYTSVHYVFSAKNDLRQTFEIQVRTLAEELWGEVDHKLNYPKKHQSVSCKEQIAVLARVTSGCTRLVDSIIQSDQEHAKWKSKQKRPMKAASINGSK